MKRRSLWIAPVLAAVLAVVALQATASGVSPLEESLREGGNARVVMLHGLGRSDRAMRRLARRFEQEGLMSHPIGYDSTTQDIDEIVAEIDRDLAACCGDAARLHFVTHSLGGIVLRAWIAREGSQRLGRVVMLSPPNHGSELVDRLGGLSRLLGPTGRALGTGPESTPSRLNRLGPVGYELGVIAGDRSFNWLGSWILDGPDDGTVSVESAKLTGMSDFLVLPSSHSFMMYDREVARQAIHFVRYGRFDALGEGDDLDAGVLEAAGGE
jgi:pimeloyl-ACP methyl ester carboxylesterase